MRRRHAGLLIILFSVLFFVGCGEDTVPSTEGRSQLQIISVTPGNGSTDAPVTTLFQIRFSRETDPQELAGLSIGVSRFADKTNVPVARTLLRDRKTLVLSPTQDLAPASTYALRVTAKTTSLDGAGVITQFATASVARSDTVVDFAPLDPERLTPFPSNLFCETDPDTATGLRLMVPRHMVLFNIRPEELEKGDGFTPYPRIVIPLTGPVSERSLPADPLESVDPAGSMFLVNVDRGSPGYGQRVPILVETDAFGEAMLPEKHHCLIAFPLHPLRMATTYALVVSRRLLDPGHGPVGPSETFERILQQDPDPALQKAREVLDPVLAYLRSPARELPLLEKDLALVLPFTTRSKENLAGDLLALRDFVFSSAMENPPEVIITSTTDQPSMSGVPLKNIKRLVKGTVASPDFRGKNGLFDLELIYERPWDAPLVPLEFILTIPEEASEENPVPLMIFLHGINSVKEQMFPVAEAMGEEGIAAIAIDIVEHGTRQTVPGLPSWIPFLRIEDFAAGRDNMRQTQIDNLTLARAVQLSLCDALGEKILKTDELIFAGNSLGGILAPAYLALEPSVKGAVLYVTGGGFTEIALRNSVIDSGTPLFYLILFLLSVIPGDHPYEFLYGLADLAQEIVDQADPIPYAPFVNGELLDQQGSLKNVLLLEVMGDDTIPNRSSENLARSFSMNMVRPVRKEVPGIAPLDGPMIGNGPNRMTTGLVQFDWVTVNGERVRADHGSLLRALEGHRVAAHFLKTSLSTGKGEILSAYPEESGLFDSCVKTPPFQHSFMQYTDH